MQNALDYNNSFSQARKSLGAISLDERPHMASDTVVNPRTFTWEGIKVTAPGGDLRHLIELNPFRIWQTFQLVNPSIHQSVYRKVRSCLTEVYIGYLDEAKQRLLLSAEQAKQAKQKWKATIDWQYVENWIARSGCLVQKASAANGRLTPPLLQGHSVAAKASNTGATAFSNEKPNPNPMLDPPCLFLTPATPECKATDLESAFQAVRNYIKDSDGFLLDAASATDENTYKKIQIKLPDSHTIISLPSKKRKLEDEPLSPTTLPFNTSLSNLSPEESSDLWLNYNLRSVLEANPPSVSRDPRVIDAVESARPYLLSLKTRLDCLLLAANDEFTDKELKCAYRDLETAWGCLSVVGRDSL